MTVYGGVLASNLLEFEIMQDHIHTFPGVAGSRFYVKQNNFYILLGYRFPRWPINLTLFQYDETL